jgi:hypothetical protein
MLLGECPPEPAGPPVLEHGRGAVQDNTPSPAGLDVLHATSAALMQALRGVLLDADFENAMKALTSWIPVKDEELLMKVTRAEYKQRHGKKREKA